MHQPTDTGHHPIGTFARRPTAGELRECRTCRKIKDTDEFYENPRHHCKECVRQRHRDWYRITSGKDRVFDQSLRRLYGITLEQYNEKKAEQDGLCGLCGQLPATTRRLHVDHDHATGKRRDLLCHHCNALLGNARDSTERLRQAIAYLERHKNCQ